MELKKKNISPNKKPLLDLNMSVNLARKVICK